MSPPTTSSTSSPMRSLAKLCGAVIGSDGAFLCGPVRRSGERCEQLSVEGDAVVVEINGWIEQPARPSLDVYRLRELVEEAIDLASWAKERADAIVHLCGWTKQFDILNGQAAHLEIHQRVLLRSLMEAKLREQANRLTQR